MINPAMPSGVYVCLADDNGIEVSAVCDSAVWSLYGSVLKARASLKGFDVLTYPNGEGLHPSQNLYTLDQAFIWIDACSNPQ